MKRELTHEEAFAALDAAALDVLDVVERDAVLWHAAGCAICTAELESLRDAAAMIALSSPLAADTATRSRGRIRSKLIARATDERAPGQAFPAAPPIASPSSTPPAAQTPVVRTLPTYEQLSSPVPHVLFPAAKKAHGTEGRFAWFKPEWLAVAATIVAVASMAGLAVVMRDRDTIEASLREQATTTSQARTTADSLRSALMSRDSLIAGMTGKNVAMMTLTASGTRQPMGHMFWDQAHNMWTLVAHDMPALKSGRTYQLWLMTAKTKINAGTFTASASGDAMMRTMYPLTPADLKAVAVTDEPAGGMPQPTGSMVMVAQAH